MLTGMGSLSYGELAGERMRLGLMLNDPEEEQDCFSDNTPQQPLQRRARRPERLPRPLRADRRHGRRGAVARSDLVAEADPALDAEIAGKLDATVAALGAIVAAAEGGMAYDTMLEAGQRRGRGADHGRRWTR